MTDGTETDGELPAESRIGRAALRVGNLDRVRDFYINVVGLRVLDRRSDATDGGSTDSVVLGAGDVPLLTLFGRPDAPERQPGEAGLFHVAFRVPTRAALGTVLERIESRWRLTGASEHLVSEALYCRDPEGNGVEIYRDRERDEWPIDSDGRVEMGTLPLDRTGVLEAAPDGRSTDQLPPGTDIGHIHLEAVDLEATRTFYTDVVGLRLRQRMAGATFLAAGEYHHHVGLNVWNRSRDPAGESRGLAWYELLVPQGTVCDLRSRLERADLIPDDDETQPHWDGETSLEALDPAGVRVRFRTPKTPL